MPIHDLSYAHWGGAYRRTLFRWRPMVTYHLRLFMKKKMIWLILFCSYVPAIGVSFMIYVASPEGAAAESIGIIERVVGQSIEQGMSDAPGMALDPTLTMAERYVEITRRGFFLFLIYFQAFCVLMTVSAVGSGLIARDVRSNALEIYLTKPISRLDYVLGKLAVIAVFVFLVTFAPSAVIFLAASALLPGYFSACWHVLLPLAAACVIASFVNGVVILGLSSLARSSRFATVIWFALCFLTAIVGISLNGVTQEPTFYLISYRGSFEYVFDALFQANIMAGRVEGDQHLPLAVPIAILAVYVLGASLVLRSTIQGREYRS
jgi:ABC-2 type transport system permease protein